MSSAKTRAVAEINLEEFERRLRAAGAPQAGVEDPLSELTRLVNTIAADRPGGEKVVDIASARTPKTEASPPAPRVQVTAATPVEQVAPPVPASPAPPPPRTELRAPSRPVAERTPAAPPPPAARPVVKDPAPPLRASFDEEIAAAAVRSASEARLAEAESFEDAVLGDEYASPAPLHAGEPIVLARPKRRGRWYLKVASLTGLAVLMVGGAVAMKVGGLPGLHKSPPLILAADGPSKIAPPNETNVQSPGDTGALLLKDSASPQPSPIKLVSTEEQPVDLLAQSPSPAPKTGADKPPAAATGSTNLGAEGQLAPAPNTPVVAPSEGLGGAPASGPTLFPSAKRVKTVSVRPDGTVISADTTADTPSAQNPAPSPAVEAPVRKADNAGAAALAATPTLDIPAKPEAPAKLEVAVKPAAKSSARVNTAKADPTALADGANAPLQLGPAARAARPKKSKPAVVADATPSAADTNTTPTFETASAGGGWAVQLAAPRSESEAQGAISRLQNKYSDNLGSKPLGVHKAEVNGETIYRVRAGGMTKAEALSMCSKLKASGGDCFVARNN
jgi:hypothetical protein